MAERTPSSHHLSTSPDTPVFKFSRGDLIAQFYEDGTPMGEVGVGTTADRNFDAATPSGPGRQLPASVYLSDGYSLIDLVMVYRQFNAAKMNAKTARRHEYRRKFESHLRDAGFELEEEISGELVFVKLHAPLALLLRQAELERIDLPFHPSDLRPPKTSRWRRLFRLIGLARLFELQPQFRLAKDDLFTHEYHHIQDSLFMYKEHPLCPSMRIYLAMQAIKAVKLAVDMPKRRELLGLQIGRRRTDRGSWAQATKKQLSFDYFLNNQTYEQIYPVHDAPLTSSGQQPRQLAAHQWPLRTYLATTWATYSQWSRDQPLDEIRAYFGEKTAFHFAWMEFYTRMLILPAVLGLVAVLVSFVYIFGNVSDDVIRNETFCPHKKAGLYCRYCNAVSPDADGVLEAHCGFVDPSDQMYSARFRYVIEHPATYAFSVFMSIWSVAFIALWKRRQKTLAMRWDAEKLEENLRREVRPDYQVRVNRQKFNPVTQQYEPYMTKSDAGARLAASIASVLFLLSLVVGTIVGILVYKRSYKFFAPTFVKNQLFGSLTASILNGVCITLMSYVYKMVAYQLTRFEVPRTQEEFEQSYVYKMVIFQFVNIYGVLFYLIFVRPLFHHNPFQAHDLIESCPPSGCLPDIAVQLIIIMAVKQFIQNVVEFGLPFLKKWREKHGHRSIKAEMDVKQIPTWRRDYTLKAQNDFVLDDNNSNFLEMLFQYGFVTMFSAALPLMPLLALLNNIVEIRLDAYNALVQTQRPFPMRAKSIEPWGRLFVVFTRIAVVTNGMLLAFNTDFAEKFLNSRSSLAGVHIPVTESGVNFQRCTLLNTSEWCVDAQGALTTPECLRLRTEEGSDEIVDRCWVDDSLEKYSDGKIEHSIDHYRSDRARFLVMLLFYVVVGVSQVGSESEIVNIFGPVNCQTMNFISYVIPDVPDHVIVREQRSRHVWDDLNRTIHKRTVNALRKLSDSRLSATGQLYGAADSLPLPSPDHQQQQGGKDSAASPGPSLGRRKPSSRRHPAERKANGSLATRKSLPEMTQMEELDGVGEPENRIRSEPTTPLGTSRRPKRHQPKIVPISEDVPEIVIDASSLSPTHQHNSAVSDTRLAQALAMPASRSDNPKSRPAKFRAKPDDGLFDRLKLRLTNLADE